MADEYFSEREHGPLPRTVRELPNSAWEALVALLMARIRDGSFGRAFPALCQEYETETIGTDAELFGAAFAGDVPALGWPLPVGAPDAAVALDLVQFAYRHVADVEARGPHPFLRHHHLTFDVNAGQTRWRQDVERLLRRNGLAFEITPSGLVRRLGERITRERISALPPTGDKELDAMFERACELYFTPEPAKHREALMHLWRAFERLKSSLAQDKKASTATLLDFGADEPHLRAILEDDTQAMTDAGNSLTIRHSEVGKVRIQREDQVDYLFGRLFNIVWLVLPSAQRSQGRKTKP